MYRYENVAGQVREWIAAGTLKPGDRLLDLGCGDGGFLRVARALGYDARGIEIDPAAAALARRQGFEVHEGAFAEAAIEPGSLAQVTLSHVIEHLHEPVDTLRQLLGWLKPGGRVWLQTPNVEGRGAARYGADWRGLEPPRHLVLFGERSLRLAIELRLAQIARPKRRRVGIGDVFRKQALAFLMPVHLRAQHRQNRNVGYRHRALPARSRDALPRPANFAGFMVNEW